MIFFLQECYMATEFGVKNIVINSKDKSPESTSDSDFYINIASWPRRPRGVCVESVQMYNTQYTIHQNNNLLRWTDSASVAHITELTKGNYTASALATHIATKMNADDSVVADTYTCTYDTSAGKITIANGTANFHLNFAVTSRSVGSTIGFSATDLSGAMTYTGQSVVNLSNKYFTIHADCVHDTSYSAVGNLADMIAQVPVDAQFGDMLNFQADFRKIYPVITEINRIHIVVRDDTGNIAQLNGVPFSMVLVLTY
jgi:hypothetical protein